MTTATLETQQTRRVHTTTVIRAAKLPHNELRIVVSVDPFGPDASSHLQRYKMHANGKLTLLSDSPYRLEKTACSAFDDLHNLKETNQ